MKSSPVAILLALAALAGCLSGGSDDADRTTPPADREPPDVDVGDEPLRAGTPLLGPGLSWTYAADGAWDTETSFTVVVASFAATGYLFAGGAEAELVGEICWKRPLFGERDADLNRIAADANGDAIVLFDFPLTDGKTWTDRGRTVTAREEDVAAPGGPLRGFAMTTDDGAERWTYVPAIGYVTEYTLTQDGGVKLHAVLQSFGRSSSWTWYEERSHLVDETDTASVGTLDVAADQDALVVYAGGAPGARGGLVPPLGSGASPWTFEATDAEDNFATILDGLPGTWSYAVATPPEGEVYLNAAVVRWVSAPPNAAV